jgi:hypothetical protein
MQACSITVPINPRARWSSPRTSPGTTIDGTSTHRNFHHGFSYLRCLDPIGHATSAIGRNTTARFGEQLILATAATIEDLEPTHIEAMNAGLIPVPKGPRTPANWHTRALTFVRGWRK